MITINVIKVPFGLKLYFFGKYWLKFNFIINDASVSYLGFYGQKVTIMAIVHDVAQDPLLTFYDWQFFDAKFS